MTTDSTNPGTRQPAANCGHGEKLSRKKEQAIAALLTAPTLKKAGELAGVSERTLRNWLAEPAFAAEYRKARERLIAQTVAILHCAAVPSRRWKRLPPTMPSRPPRV